jgi:predicted nucleic acid-binding protein
VLHQLPYYDALIVQAAIASGCMRVFSEILHHGGVYSGVRIENPFAPFRAVSP